MSFEIKTIPASHLAEYASIPIGFWVHSRFGVEEMAAGLGGLRLVEEPVSPAYFKDYDTLAAEDSPIFWPKHFDLAHWGLFLAQDHAAKAGGAAVAFQTTGVNMLEGRDELAVLWNIRVQPAVRGQGIGKALFNHARDWARQRGARQLKIETQNINVPACRFYAVMGCHLGMIHRHAYAGVPGCADEVMLCWYLDLQ